VDLPFIITSRPIKLSLAFASRRRANIFRFEPPHAHSQSAASVEQVRVNRIKPHQGVMHPGVSGEICVGDVTVNKQISLDGTDAGGENGYRTRSGFHLIRQFSGSTLALKRFARVLDDATDGKNK
jgi:hypothetical protein